MAPAHSGTFQPLLHRSGTLRERLHSYTKRTLGAGGSINEAVSFSVASMVEDIIWGIFMYFLRRKACVETALDLHSEMPRIRQAVLRGNGGNLLGFSPSHLTLPALLCYQPSLHFVRSLCPRVNHAPRGLPSTQLISTTISAQFGPSCPRIPT
jgi:hypothetical protein